MNRKQYFMLLAVALAGGMIGGVISNWIPAGMFAFADESSLKHLKTIVAEKFVVTDRDGRIRTVLGMIDGAPSLMMFGRRNSRPRLLIFDHEDCRAELALNQDGAASLNLFDQTGLLRTAVGAARIKSAGSGKIIDLPAAFILFNHKGRVSWAAPEPASP